MLAKVLTWLLALLFVAGGIPKLLGLGSVESEFTRFGYSTGFRLLIGVLEVGGGLALLVPALALFGAAVLLVIMVGATWTLVHVGDAPTPPIVVGALLVVLVALRWRSKA
jgi:uncharacterized membrane protein YphA (DoxX/SURF4 family)